MKTLNKLKISSDRILTNEDLISLKGGYYDPNFPDACMCCTCDGPWQISVGLGRTECISYCYSIRDSENTGGATWGSCAEITDPRFAIPGECLQ